MTQCHLTFFPVSPVLNLSPHHKHQSSPPPPAPGAAVELVPLWLKSLPLAPEFHPTAIEFADPVAYILKIEPIAAPFGICKVVPPCPQPPKKTTLSNLARSFAALHPDDPAPSFLTRHQQLGLCPRRPRPALKPVWQSFHRYTLPQFESKATASRKPLLARLNVPASKHLSPLDLEALFWRASADRPITIEYASDMSGSGFSSCAGRPTQQPPAHVGETAWNMRGVARSPGSLLRFMREEVPGVSTPMLYVAMMFSWFAWHLEDHDLHSLNYMHFGAAKTWYGVPRDAALAFEEVVRVHGYGGEVNPLETFATLGQKTTVMSPEVLVGLGIPSCRLVQNAGEFVVTFPGSYHCGFSHGFNCGEASNIATPEWLRVAKEAAIRRASINYPPMVSHYQLLYELALSMCFREPSIGAMEPRSSRLKEKKKGEGAQLVKKIFVQNVIEDNELLSRLLNDGSSCIILPINARDGPVFSALCSRSQSKTKSRLSDGLGSSGEALDALGCLPLNGTLDKNDEIRNCGALSSSKESALSVHFEKKFSSARGMHDCVNVSSPSDTHDAEGDEADKISAAGLLDQGLLSCVSCGILSFSCVAVIKPREYTAKYLMSSDYNLINDQLGSGGSHLADALRCETTNGGILRSSFQPCGNEIISDVAPLNRNTALDLLVSAYGDQSDSDEDILNKKIKVSHDSNELLSHMTEPQPNSSSNVCVDGAKVSSISEKCQQRPSQSRSDMPNGPRGVRTRNKYQLKMVLSKGFQPKDMYSTMERKVQSEPLSAKMILKEPVDVSGTDYDARYNNTTISVGDPRSSTTTMNNLNTSSVKSDKESSRMHVFCLEHAIEVEKQLQAIGGAHIILLCRPEYLKIEAEARSLAAEMEVEYDWKDIDFREANMQDREMVQEVLRDEEAIPTSSDWSVKLGINLYYSANLAKSPLYNKQMPYNRIIYRAFGCSSPKNSPVKLKTYERRQGRQKKIVFAGRWCGKVWMSNQVHPYLAHRIESRELEETDGICSYHLDNSSRVAASKTISSTRTDVPNSSKKQENRPLEETNTKRVKHTEELPNSSKKRENRPLEETNTKRVKHNEEYSSKELKGAAEVSSTSPAGMVLRSSARIANRAKKLKSEMKEGDDGPASHPKSKVKDDNDSPAGHSRAGALKQKTKVEAKKQMKKTKVEKRIASAAPKGEEEHSSTIKGCSTSSDTKQELSLHKHRTRAEAKKQVKKTREKTMTPRAPKHEEEYSCNIEGCSMSFGTKQELSLHKRDICPVKGCTKKFFSHKYLLQHRKVHTDDRPLKCPWSDCNMAFKWPWARTEHLRVHTGDRPYVCHEPGCAQTFRFVSDFSRHKRKTGHSTKKTKTQR